MTLDELALREANLIDRVEQARGGLAACQASLERDGVFRDYREVYGLYLRLLNEPGSAVEALKRSIFLAWYEVAEPAVFTGLSGLAPEGHAALLAGLDRLFGSDTADAELRWMLPWYHRVCDAVFAPLSAFTHLAAFLSSARADAFYSAAVTPQQFANRGAMGKYWCSITVPPNKRLQRTPLRFASGRR